MDYLRILILLVLIAILASACAATPNDLAKTPDEDGEIAGFWRGLWHGFISPFAFLVSLFSDNVNIYEVHNNGNWYNFGFMIGVSIIFGGSGGGAARRRR
jgi:hypothetical protein